MKIAIINLDRRVDRWCVVREHIHDIGFRGVIRFTAVDEKIGWKGCAKSHIAIIKQWKNEKEFLILEDDVEFLGDISLIDTAMAQLPEDWDALFLGASPQESQGRYSANLFRLKNAFCTHAIIWHPRENGAIDYILNHKEEIGKIDIFFSRHIYPNFNCYLISPLLCTQRQTQSDCCKRSDLSTIKKNYTRYCI
jgi:glycosyl transferase family 25